MTGEREERALLACPDPWCPSNKPDEPEFGDGGLCVRQQYGVVFAVECHTCGLAGPTRKTEQEAEAAWNTRPVSTQERDAAGEGEAVDGNAFPTGMALVPREPTEAMLAASEREWDGRMSARSAGVWQAMIAAYAPQPTPATDDAVLVEQVSPIPSPVTRLAKGYANQRTDGTHMVDLIDAANGNVICRCVYEPYADEILAALRSPSMGEGG